MSERKVLNKYYPPDYEPSKIPRIKRKDKLTDSRVMAPFNMRCNTCGNYIASATKFNAKKETVEDANYAKLQSFRIYIKCPRCMASIVLRTNLKAKGYEVEHGATENFMALKLAEKQAQEEAEAEEEEEKINPMKHLEKRTKASKQQMEASEQIQNLRSIKYKYHTVDIDSFIQERRKEELIGETRLAIKEGTVEDEEIQSEARSLLKGKCLRTQEESSSSSNFKKITLTKPSSSKNKLSSSLSNLKKKIKIVPKTSSCGDKDEPNNKND